MKLYLNRSENKRSVSFCSQQIPLDLFLCAESLVVGGGRRRPSGERLFTHDKNQCEQPALPPGTTL